MADAPLKHIVFITGISWSHIFPGIAISLRMVKMFHDLFISVFVRDSEVLRATKYLNAQSSVFSNRVTIIAASSSGIPLPAIFPPVFGTFDYLGEAFKYWMKKEFQRTTEDRIDGRLIGKPGWIIEDQQTGGVSLTCKDIYKLPIISYWIGSAASLIGRHGDLENGHAGRVFDTISRQGISFSEMSEMYLQEVSDRLVCIPGVPTQHEWELVPQYAPSILSLTIPSYKRRAQMIQHFDMVICGSTFEMEPLSASALSSALGKPMIPFLLGPSVDLKSPPNLSDLDHPIVTEFLDRAYTEKGAHSVIYVAFGTIYFPPPSSISHLITILDEITNSGLRFIIALTNGSGALDKSWMNAHVQAGNAIFPEWTKQTAVLNHPAIHYFLSHGGWNSCTEALLRGVPMVFWPFGSDQPITALQIATVHDCGFELLQVRTGPAKSTAYRNGQEVKIVGTDEAVRREIQQILGLSKGPKGKHQRVNARLLGKVLADSLEEGGSGDHNLAKFGKALGLVE